MKSRNRPLRLGILVSAVVWFEAVWAQTERVKLTVKGQWQGDAGRVAVAVAGNYAYAADGTNLNVIDISNPANPQRVGESVTTKGVYDVVVSGDYTYVTAVDAGLLIFEITELPAITRAEHAANSLTLEWNEPARGMNLQRSTSLTNPIWEDLSDSDKTDRVTLPVSGGNEFFRLMKP